MFRNRIPLWASAFALALFCLPQSGEAGGGVVIGPGSGVCDSISRNPVLIYDVTGGTLIGLVHRNLVVYDDGTATISKRDETVFPAPGTIDEDVAIVSVGQPAVRSLVSELFDEGAGTLCDQSNFFLDVPLTTVTFLRGRGDQRAHTFSYLGGGGDYAGVQGAISDFINTYFPGF